MSDVGAHRRRAAALAAAPRRGENALEVIPELSAQESLCQKIDAAGVAVGTIQGCAERTVKGLHDLFRGRRRKGHGKW